MQILIRKKSIFLLFLMMLISIGLVAQEKYGKKDIKKGKWKDSPVEYVEGQIAVKVSTGISEKSAEAFLAKVNANFVKKVNKHGWGIIEVPEGVDVFKVIEELKSYEVIEDIEPNMIIHPHATPNDTYYNSQWWLDIIEAPDAWDSTMGDSDIMVAVLDSGIPLNSGTLTLSHPDLDDASRFIIGPDIVGDGSSVRDAFGHGTHVAGIVGAETDNSTGVAGVAGDCKILTVQVFSGTGSGSWYDLADGIDSAIARGAQIINFSGGGSSYSSIAEQAIREAYNSGVVMTISAGNDGGSVSYPARFSTYGRLSGHRNGYSNVICVSATDDDDVFSSYSNRGSQVTVAAPGGYGYPYDSDDILSTTPNYSFYLAGYGISQNYGYMAGTSMAAPVVAGVAALVLSVNNNLTAAQVRDIIEASADDLGATGFDNYYGYGRVNAYEAVLYTINNYGWQTLQRYADNSFELSQASQKSYEFALKDNYPNPFNPTTVIAFTLPKQDNVKLVVYDILGREVMRLAEGAFEAGEHSFQFNASDLASGIYVYSLQTSSNIISKKMLLMK